MIWKLILIFIGLFICILFLCELIDSWMNHIDNKDWRNRRNYQRNEVMKVRNPYRGMRRKDRPPMTTRYCPVCEKMTTWRYDPNICHSRCLQCGSSVVRDVLNG